MLFSSECPGVLSIAGLNKYYMCVCVCVCVCMCVCLCVCSPLHVMNLDNYSLTTNELLSNIR